VERDYVGMMQCFFCGEAKEVLLDRRLKKTLPRMAVYDHEPCDKCKGWMKQGIILISVRQGSDQKNPYRTGGWVVIKEDAFRRFFKDSDEALRKRIAFVEDEVWDTVGLPRENKES
jgi:hypothetical protein